MPPLRMKASGFRSQHGARGPTGKHYDGGVYGKMMTMIYFACR
jgi:hypothetical protein